MSPRRMRLPSFLSAGPSPAKAYRARPARMKVEDVSNGEYPAQGLFPRRKVYPIRPRPLYSLFRTLVRSTTSGSGGIGETR